MLRSFIAKETNGQTEGSAVRVRSVCGAVGVRVLQRLHMRFEGNGGGDSNGDGSLLLYDGAFLDIFHRHVHAHDNGAQGSETPTYNTIIRLVHVEAFTYDQSTSHVL